MMTAAVQELRSIKTTLQGIENKLDSMNSTQVQGSGGENGFAQHVYDFVQMRVEETDEAENSEDGQHQFFVYYPDINWYPAFRRLIRQNPLPRAFCAKSDDLDALCNYMRSIRSSLIEESKDGKDIVFHLLIPAWSPGTKIMGSEPLHFPDELQSFQVEGETYQSQPCVSFNLPYAPEGLLQRVGNVLSDRRDTIAKVSGEVTVLLCHATFMAGTAAAMSLGGPLAGIPILMTNAVASNAIDYASDAIEKRIAEHQPRILGSNERVSLIEEYDDDDENGDEEEEEEEEEEGK